MEWEIIIELVVKLAFALFGGIITIYVVPWLKEKNLYNTVKKMVQAAEKWNKTTPINKKAWVMEQLSVRGITVDPYVEALIESAVMELDAAIAKAAEGTDTVANDQGVL